ncbi:MAG: molybdopterin-dependent oxidoreductase, partial [Anaerolineae bacterium]|nr:molybdopterin-dependent oxidoreductase [Anaerolineae bacterium]
KRIAAHMLEAAPEDMEYVDGRAQVKGAPDRFKTFGEVALMAHLAHIFPKDLEPGLEATTFFDPSNFTFPFCAHIAVVEVDAATGHVDVKRYVAVDDVGNIINPMIVDGQLHGGIAQGIGQALYENAVFDENGQLVSGSMMDYALPRARYIPMIETDKTITPAPQNILGVKGVGEIGAIASPAAIANAVVDALRPFGVTHINMPITAERVYQAINANQ